MHLTDLESLDAETTGRPREVAEAWNAEIERRLAAYQGGEIGAVPASEVFEEARDLARLRDLLLGVRPSL